MIEIIEEEIEINKGWAIKNPALAIDIIFNFIDIRKDKTITIAQRPTSNYITIVAK